MKTDFTRQIYGEAKHLFAEGEVEVLVAQPSFLEALPQQLDLNVQLIHLPTGIKQTVGDFPSQMENFIAAVIRLRIACDKHYLNKY